MCTYVCHGVTGNVWYVVSHYVYVCHGVTGNVWCVVSHYVYVCMSTGDWERLVRGVTFVYHW